MTFEDAVSEFKQYILLYSGEFMCGRDNNSPRTTRDITHRRLIEREFVLDHTYREIGYYTYNTHPHVFVTDECISILSEDLYFNEYSTEELFVHIDAYEHIYYKYFDE